MDKISWVDFKKLFDTKRDRNIICPGCKKSNKDGKFATFIDGSPGDGKCFSCDYFQYKGLNRMSSFVSSRPDIEYNYIMGALWGSLICLCFCILLIVILCLSIQDNYDGSE